MRRAIALAVVVAALVPSPARAQAPVDPPWSVPEASLAAGLQCPATFEHPEREPVLLVHGTFTTGPEQFSWNYQLLLAERGFDACTVTYPDRGLGDMQVSAEYVAYAITELYARTGRRVDLMGHSQGGVVPRWAIKFWPSARAAVDDAVLVAPPSHGIALADGADQSPFPLPASNHQFDPGSAFLAALNDGDETPGDVSWSVLYARLDELVQPSAPVPTAALDWGREGTNVRNVAVEDVCPGRIVDHLTIGTTDRLSQELVLDAFTNPGPFDPARLAPLPALCALPDQYVVPATLPALVAQLPVSFAGGFPDLHLTDVEPPLKAYAVGAPAPSTPAAPDDVRSTAAPASPAEGPATLAASGGGASTTALAGGLVLAAALFVSGRAGSARPRR